MFPTFWTSSQILQRKHTSVYLKDEYSLVESQEKTLHTQNIHNVVLLLYLDVKL